MCRADRGATFLEYTGVIMLIAGIVTVVAVTTDVPATITQGIESAICKVLQRTDCEVGAPAASAPEDVDPGDAEPEAAPIAEQETEPASTNPVADFASGGMTRLADAARSVGCMFGLCDDGGFERGWANAAQAITSPRLGDIERCADLGEAAPDTPTTRADGSPRQEMTVGTCNMAGNAKNEGGTDVVDAIVESVENRRPMAVNLQEVCSNQVSDLRRKLPDGYHVRFSPVQRNSYVGGEFARCSDAEEYNENFGSYPTYGNAVIYHEDFLGEEGVRATPHDLATPDVDGKKEEKREMMCVSSDTTRTVVCSAHLTNEIKEDCEVEGSSDNLCDWSVEAREAEAEEAARIAEEEYPGYSVVLGGDFNNEPRSDALDPLYDERYGDGASGRFREADSAGQLGGSRWFGLSCRGGEDTQGDSKIDYLFVSDDVVIHDANSTHSDYSDHDPYWSVVTL